MASDNVYGKTVLPKSVNPYPYENPPSYEPYMSGQSTIYNPNIGTTISNQPQIVYNPNMCATNSNQPQMVYNTQFMPATQRPEIEVTRLKYRRLHLGLGIFFIVIGVITCIIDPLLPLLFFFPYYIMPAGILLIVSGILSITGSKSNNHCCLIAALVLDIFASLILFSGVCVGAIVSSVFYYSSSGGLSIFYIIFCGINFCLVIWDSGIKCGDVCCGTRIVNPVPPAVTYVYAIPNAPMVP